MTYRSAAEPQPNTTVRLGAVIPAKAGIHARRWTLQWIPAFAGMTVSLTRGRAGKMLAKTSIYDLAMQASRLRAREHIVHGCAGQDVDLAARTRKTHAQECADRGYPVCCRGRPGAYPRAATRAAPTSCGPAGAGEPQGGQRIGMASRLFRR